MADIPSEKISQFNDAPDFQDVDRLAGYRLNDDSTKTNYKYSLAQILAALRQPFILDGTIYTLSSDLKTITGPYFSNTIQALSPGGGSYYTRNVDFTQSGMSITFTNGNTCFLTQQFIAFQ